MTTLLLTGATGMVGREVFARAAADRGLDRVLCLIRPGGGQTADERLDEICEKVGVRRTARLRALPGEVTEPGLGVSARLLAAVSHVIHCAATVSFDLPLPEARRINVGGTRNVLDACDRMKRLERLDAVSTCYVAGKREGLVLEADLYHAGGGFHNTYEQTKYESELLLRAAMPQLPIAVHRPSIVVGDSRTGRTGAWKVLYWPLKVVARGWLPVIPYDPGSRLDIVPVDFVADAIMALGADPSTIGGTFHLAAGPTRDTTAGDLFRHVFARMDQRPPVRVPPALFRNLIRPMMMLTPSSGLRRTLRTGLIYRPYLELRLQFDTREADAHLEPAGVWCPAVADYIDTIVQAALDSDFGRIELPPAGAATA